MPEESSADNSNKLETFHKQVLRKNVCGHKNFERRAGVLKRGEREVSNRRERERDEKERWAREKKTR